MAETTAGRCELCEAGATTPYRLLDGVQYLRCDACHSLIAEPSFLRLTEKGQARVYDQGYWAEEMHAAQQRGFGSSVIRVGELFHYARRPLRRLLDVSCGSGSLLDAVTELLPDLSERFWGIEPFPPPEEFQSRHANYRVGFLNALDGTFDGGVCVEVIEHLTPDILRELVRQIGRLSNDDAIWYFNSAQPTFVERHDPGYLDPYKRGHVASYTLEGLRPIFLREGLVIHRLPGRDWAFLAEKSAAQPLTPDELYRRVWRPLPENIAALKAGRFGNLVAAAGLEGARCYLEVARSEWALSNFRQRPRFSWKSLLSRTRRRRPQ